MHYRKKSDNELSILLTKNDENAFRELYLRYKDKLWHYTFSFLKSKEESEDMVQEIFIRLWELRGFIDPDLSISSFLYMMIKNRILNYFRHMDVEEQYKKVLSAKLAIQNESTEAEFIFTEYQKILTEAIEALPPQRKRIFNMSRTENKSHKEISTELGISVPTVQEHVSESLRFIKTHFAKHTDLTLSIITLALLY